MISYIYLQQLSMLLLYLWMLLLTLLLLLLTFRLFFVFMSRALYRVFQIVVKGRGGGKSPPGGEGIENFAEGRGVYRVVRTWGVIVTIRTFFKAKTAFCEYWTSIKIKISLTSVSWNQNKNGTGAKTTAKNDVFIGL